MKHLIRIHLLMVVFFLTSVTLNVEGAEWLGEYVGSEIPGYEILKSKVEFADQSGGPTDDKMPHRQLYEKFVEYCKNKGCRAIVNLHFLYTLGDVSWIESNNSGRITKISPGATGIVYGDCVYEAKPKK